MATLSQINIIIASLPGDWSVYLTQGSIAGAIDVYGMDEAATKCVSYIEGLKGAQNHSSMGAKKSASQFQKKPVRVLNA